MQSLLYQFLQSDRLKQRELNQVRSPHNQTETAACLHLIKPIYLDSVYLFR